jgi:hypothetical protein
MSTKPKTENITLLPYGERLKLVRERLNGLRHPKTTPLPKSEKVQAAQKVWDEWVANSEAHIDAQKDAHRAKLNDVQDAMIVGDMAKAVALLQKLGA